MFTKCKCDDKIVLNSNGKVCTMRSESFELFLNDQYEEYQSCDIGYNSVRSLIYLLAYREYCEMTQEEKHNILLRDFSDIKLRLTDDEHKREVMRHLKGSVRAYYYEVNKCNII